MADLGSLEAQFRRPPLEHGPVPFWFLNEVLEPDRLAWQLEQMHAQHVDAAVLHPRPGMVTPYLSEEFWEAIGACLDKARELGMRVWLYDDYPWASGTAAGLVPAADPEYVMRNMDLVATDVQGPRDLEWPLPRNVVSVTAAPVLDGMRIEGDAMVDLRDHVVNGKLAWRVPKGIWRVMAVARRRGLTTCGDPYGTQEWADLTNPDAMDLFIELTHEEYRKRFESTFGKTAWAVFTDEPPSTFPALGATTLQRFHELHGYDLAPELPLLWYEGGDRTAKVRCDYYDTLATQYEEGFFERCGTWCEDHGLDLGGHLLLEENLILNTRFMANAFRQLRHLSIPGIDWIFPGRIPSSVPKLAASIAHNYGRNRVMSETYALAGWAAEPQWMRWQMQWEFVHGVDLLVPHAFFYSISDTVPIPPAPDDIGYRWYDCPPSMFFRQPYWRHYHHFADLVARTSYLLTRGTHVAQVAVFYPIESVWADYALADGWLRGVHTNVLDLPGSWMTADTFEDGPSAVVTDGRYRAIVEGLRERTVDCDILDDDTLQRADIVRGTLDTGNESFELFVLPAVRTIRLETLKKIARYSRSGGTVVALHCLPERASDGPEHDAEVRALVREIWHVESGDASEAKAAHLFIGGFGAELEGVMSLLRPNVQVADWGIDVQQRSLEGAELFYLTSRLDHAVDTEVTLRAIGRPERWDPLTGERAPITRFCVTDDSMVLQLSFEPYDGTFVVISDGDPGPRILATNLTAAELLVEERRVVVEGLLPEGGAAWAEVEIDGDVHRMEGGAEGSPLRIELADTWEFSVLPFPDDEHWYDDMDRLELMFPEDGIPTSLRTGSWTEQGLRGFSGTGRYGQRFGLPDGLQGQRLVLDLGAVKVAARVYLNGELVGDRLWAPYTFTLRGAHLGENELLVEVSNTLANYIAVRHADSDQPWAHPSESELASGILGPVALHAVPQARLELTLP
jgi:hypothetical protein